MNLSEEAVARWRATAEEELARRKLPPQVDEYDTYPGRVVWRREGARRIVGAAALAGTYALGPGTWLWSWANEAIPSTGRRGLERVREVGAAQRLRGLTGDAEQRIGEVEASGYVALAGLVLGAAAHATSENFNLVSHFLVSEVREAVALELPIEPGHPRREAVLTEPLAGERYRVLFSPAMAPGIAAGDVIEPVHGHPWGRLVHERGGHVCVHVMTAGELLPAFEALRVEVEALGGWIGSSAFGAAVSFTIPVSAGFSAIRGTLDAAVTAYRGLTWSYSNVYDLDDETPLGWWERG